MKDNRNNKYIETANLYDYDVRDTAKDDLHFTWNTQNKRTEIFLNSDAVPAD